MGLGMTLSAPSVRWTCPECKRELDGTEDYDVSRIDKEQPMVTCYCGHTFYTVDEMAIRHFQLLKINEDKGAN